MELHTAFESAVASTAEIVRETPADRMEAPTPCTEWDVRGLVNHIVGTLWLAAGLFSDRPPRYPMAPGGQPAGDLAGTDPAAAYEEASAAATLAKATGQSTDLDGRLAAHVLGFATRALGTPESRAGRMAPPLSIAADAPLTSRLVAFLGRMP